MKVTVRDVSFEVEPEGWNFWEQVNAGTWEPETFDILDRYVCAAEDVLDVGAWIGPITLYAAQKARRVYAMEPDPVALMRLIGNLALSKVALSKVVLLHAALAPVDEWAGFGTSGCWGGSTSRLGVAPMFLAPTVSYATVLRLCPEPRFIKMDIEGGEEFLLPAMEKWLREMKPTLLVSFHPQVFQGSGITAAHALGGYTYRYDMTGRTLSVEDVAARMEEKLGFTVLATERAWT